MAGATLGFIVGRTVVRVNAKPLDGPVARRKSEWSAAPVVGSRVRGLQISVAF